MGRQWDLNRGRTPPTTHSYVLAGSSMSGWPLRHGHPASEIRRARTHSLTGVFVLGHSCKWWRYLLCFGLVLIFHSVYLHSCICVATLRPRDNLPEAVLSSHREDPRDWIKAARLDGGHIYLVSPELAFRIISCSTQAHCTTSKEQLYKQKAASRQSQSRKSA